MFDLDEKFFEEIGINRMPEAEREEFKKHIQEEVELRVGERISDGIPVEKLDEFEMIVDGNSDFIQSWVLSHAANYKNDQIFQAIVVQNGGQDGSESLNEYAALKWLQINRPDIQELVTSVTSEMKGELRANIDKIVG